MKSDGRRWLGRRERIPGLAERLRRARLTASLTQEQVADSLNVNRRTVYMWEAGKSEPTVQRLEDISKVLGHSFEWFASGETDNRTIHVKKIKLRVDRLSDNSLDVLDEFLTTLERAT